MQYKNMKKNEILKNKKIEEIIKNELKLFGYVRKEIVDSLEAIANEKENKFNKHRYYRKKINLTKY